MTRPLLALEIPVERVDSSITDDGFRATLAVETAEGLPPIVSEVRVSREVLEALDGTVEGREAALQDLCLEEVQRDLLVAAGLHAKSLRSPDTVRDLGTDPRISHEDRAKLFATMVREQGAELARLHGEDWLRILLESELRAVYADGERKGWAAHVSATPTTPGLG